MTFRVEMTLAARELLRRIPDRRVRDALQEKIRGLARDPEMQGKALLGNLSGFRSARAVGQRYSILYRVDRGRVLVIVFGMGIRKEGDRKDIYALAARWIRLGVVGH